MKLQKDLWVRFVVLAGLSEAGYLSFHFISQKSPDLYLKTVLITLSTGLLYLVATYTSLQADEESVLKLSGRLLLVAAIFRFTLLTLPPYLSEDLYRYLWDGWVQSTGINPYTYTPQELAHLQGLALYEKVNYRTFPTIYPPVCQILFLFSHYLGGELVWRLLVVLADLLTGIILLRLLAKQGRVRYAIIHFWSPVGVLESALGGHVDIFGALFLTLAVGSLLQSRIRQSAFWFSLAVLVKYLPLLLLPAIFRRLGLVKAIVFTAFTAMVVALLYLPYISAGWKVFGSLGAYISRWSFNSLAFEPVHALTGSYSAARVICYSAIAVVALAEVFRKDNLEEAAHRVFTAFCIFFPTLYPWYLAWIVPLVALRPSAAFCWLLVASQASYWTLHTLRLEGVWIDHAGVRVFEYLPFLILLGYDVVKKHRLASGFIFSQKRCMRHNSSHKWRTSQRLNDEDIREVKKS